jgi:hypothetical protein
MVLRFLLVFNLLLSQAVWGGIFTSEAKDLMLRGLAVHEGLEEFFQNNECPLGLKLGCYRPLTTTELAQMKNLLRDLEAWRVEAFEGIDPKAQMLNLPPLLEEGESLLIEEKWRQKKKRSNKMEPYLHITYNQEDPESQEFIRRARIGAATTLLLYDSFFRIADVLAKAKKVRAILEYDMPEEGRFLTKTYSLAMDVEKWDQTTYTIELLNQEEALRKSELTEDDLFFDQYIHKSFTGSKIMEGDDGYRIRKALYLKRKRLWTRFFERVNKVIGKLSKFFGNTVGLIQTRPGKLKDLADDPIAMADIKSQLQPLDIILEKTPFRLTDKFIPGYYGHVAIWLGTPEELATFEVDYEGEKIPLLSHPDVLPHLEKFSEGKLIVEALRKPGVTVNTLEHFMDIDDLLVLRRPPMNDEMKAQHILKAIQQIGKPYDFNFNVETEREIVCSELIYTVFSEEVWPTSVSLGRYTISPDHVAWKAVDSCYEPILMYRRGEKVEVNMKQELKEVLSGRGRIYYSPSSGCFDKSRLSLSYHNQQTI